MSFYRILISALVTISVNTNATELSDISIGVTLGNMNYDEGGASSSSVTDTEDQLLVLLATII